MRLFVVRHAKPAVTGVCYGQSDVPVEVPHEEAAADVWRRVEGARIERIVSSPFERARGLAEAICRLSGHEAPRVDGRLSELSFGEWEGRTFSEIEASDGARFALWMARYTELAAPGGETVADMDARVRAFVAEERARHAGTLLVVAHAGVVRALRRLRDATTWEEEMRRPVPYLEVSTIDLERPVEGLG
ncbi:MAG: histidine phosphatase family protein [Polyangiaceae bacterium]